MDKRLTTARKEQGLWYVVLLVPFVALAEIRYKLADIRRAHDGSLFRAMLKVWRPDLMVLGLWLALKGFCGWVRDLAIFLYLLITEGGVAYILFGVGLLVILIGGQKTTVTVRVPEVPVLESPAPTVPGGGTVMTWPITGPSTLSWSTSGAVSCRASAEPATAEWSGPKPSNGMQEVSPSQTTTYTLICE